MGTLGQPRLFQIFRAGRVISSRGEELTFTDADLRYIASAYDFQVQKAAAPLVLGHPEDNQPSYGRVNKLISDGGCLFAHATVSDGLVTAVRAGRYKKVSASFYNPEASNNPTPGSWSLRHVGFLGAQPPAVKGMQPLHFAESSRQPYASFADANDFQDEPDSASFSEAEAIAARIRHYQALIPELPYMQAVNLATRL